MKTCVYTCITNGYDVLYPRPPGNEDVDFICFTDNKNIQPNGWSVRLIPEFLLKFGQVKSQRLVKILPHIVLPKYQSSLWIDGNIGLKCDVMEFIEGQPDKTHSFLTRKHPTRNCIYDEAKAVISLKKDSAYNVLNLVDRFSQDGFPKNYGLVESGVILRRNDQKCKDLCNLWSSKIIDLSHRDQLSLNYCCWKLGIDIGFLDVNRLVDDPRFLYRIRHEK